MTIELVGVPEVSISSSQIASPVIMTRAQAGVPGIAVGFPAFAKVRPSGCAGAALSNPRKNICRDSNNNPIPDQNKWICINGSSWTANCITQGPLIDINGDGIPDNFKIGESTRATRWPWPATAILPAT